MNRSLVIACSLCCFFASTSAVSVKEIRFDTPAFQKIERSFADVGGLFNEPGPSSFMDSIHRLGHLNYRLLYAFKIYLEIFVSANHGTVTRALVDFRTLSEDLLEQLDSNDQTESSPEEENFFAKMLEQFKELAERFRDEHHPNAASQREHHLIMAMTTLASMLNAMHDSDIVVASGDELRVESALTSRTNSYPAGMQPLDLLSLRDSDEKVTFADDSNSSLQALEGEAKKPSSGSAWQKIHGVLSTWADATKRSLTRQNSSDRSAAAAAAFPQTQNP